MESLYNTYPPTMVEMHPGSSCSSSCITTLLISSTSSRGILSQGYHHGQSSVSTIHTAGKSQLTSELDPLLAPMQPGSNYHPVHHPPPLRPAHLQACSYESTEIVFPPLPQSPLWPRPSAQRSNQHHNKSRGPSRCATQVRTASERYLSRFHRSTRRG